MLYYRLLKSLHKGFCKFLINLFVAFVMRSTDIDFQHLRRVCEQVIPGEENPIACKVHLPIYTSKVKSSPNFPAIR